MVRTIWIELEQFDGLVMVARDDFALSPEETKMLMEEQLKKLEQQQMAPEKK